MGFIHAKHLNVESLSEYITGLITGFDFDLSKLVSQGYDGASLMSGNCTGIHTRVRQFAPHARNNNYWERIYTYTSEIAKLHEI